MQRSGRGGSSRPAARPAPRRASPTSAPAARPVSTSSSVPAPMQPAQSGGMLSGIGSTIMQGMAFGTGSAIAHRAVGAVAGSFSGGSEGAEQQPVAAASAPVEQSFNSQQSLTGPCASDKQMFYECLQVNKGDQQACSFLYDTLQNCQREQVTYR